MPDYDFRSLSPIDFETLMRDLLNADLGLQLVSFAVGPDGGVDLRDAREGRVTIAQCKHRPDAKRTDLVSAAIQEAARWTGAEMQNYLFVVSCPVSPEAEVDIREALAPLPVRQHGIWHKGVINAALARNSKVEKDHFKLWLSSAVVLEQILAAAQWQRSEELLQGVSERVRLYVYTPAYPEAMKTLLEEHVVLISGAPGVGKSTLAEMILLSLWHDGWTVVNIASDIDEAWRQVRTCEERVVFYYDDFLGQTSTAELQKNEASGIALLMERVRKGNDQRLLVLTSREQVLGQARYGDDDRVRHLADNRAKIRIDLAQIGRSARAQMLFNHLHFGFDDESSRAALASDTRYRQVVDHDGFNPRTLQSVVLNQEHATVDDFYSALFHALDHPETIWIGSFQQLSQTAMEILFQLATSPSTSMPVEVLHNAVRPDDPREWRAALKVLENTWIRLNSTIGAIDQAALFDPSRRDFLLDLLDDPSFFDTVMVRIFSIQQFTYLSRLAGVIEDAPGSNQRANRSFLKKSFERRQSDIDQIVTTLARRGIDTSANSEMALELRNHSPHPGSAPKTYPGYVSENLGGRIRTLTELASVVFWSQMPTHVASEFLQTQLEFFDGDFKRGTRPHASELFGLAARLASKESPDWSKRYAARIADLGFDSVYDMDDIRSYSILPQWFREGPYQVVGSKRLEESLDSQLDGIKQQNDRDLMIQWLDEVISVVEEHGVSLDVETLLRKIEEMEPSDETAKYRATPIQDNSAMEDGTDEELRMLFAKLK